MRMQSSSGSTKILPSPISPAARAATAAENGVDRRFEKLLVDGDHQLHLAKQVHRELVPAVDFGLAALPAKALHVHDRETEDLNVGQGLLDGLQAMRLDYGDD